jgi:hypothetical protein
MKRLYLGPAWEKEEENDFNALRREIEELSDYNNSYDNGSLIISTQT